MAGAGTEEGGVERARRTGYEAVASLRRRLARRSAELIRSDPEAADAALEVGLVDARWLDDPVGHPNVTSPPGEVLERFLERVVDARPSRLGTLGLGAVQLIGALAAGPSGPEVRDVAVVFTDLEGFTAFTDREGDAAALALIEAHHRHSTAVVRRNGGRVVKHLGDGLLASFPDAGAAARAAVAVVEGSPGPLRMRAGGHAGETVVTRGDLVGHAVNLAARVTEAAAGGEVLVTSGLREAAGDVPGVDFGPGRPHRLRGISGRVVLHRVGPARA